LPETGKPEKKTESHNTRKEIAKDLNWSTGKVAQADKVFKSNDEEIKQKRSLYYNLLPLLRFLRLQPFPLCKPIT